MCSHNHSSQSQCPASCEHCNSQGQPCPSEQSELSPLSTCIWSIAVFVFPLLMAVAGAVLLPKVWKHEASQLVGGLAGLAVGALLIRIALRWFGPKSKPDTTQEQQ